MRPGRVLLMEGYGLADIARKEAITACTRFELASVSKSFTATAVLMLQERGLLSIDDDVRKFIPELPRYRERTAAHPRHAPPCLRPDRLSGAGIRAQEQQDLLGQRRLPRGAGQGAARFPDRPEIRIQQYELHADGDRHRARRQEAVRRRSARRDIPSRGNEEHVRLFRPGQHPGKRRATLQQRRRLREGERKVGRKLGLPAGSQAAGPPGGRGRRDLEQPGRHGQVGRGLCARTSSSSRQA